ncbi:MAG: FecR domain-containing protein [Proteobacteria bacterium]|nr:FecR domain-containing protein [Pseudomonadota bacterium]
MIRNRAKIYSMIIAAFIIAALPEFSMAEVVAKLTFMRGDVDVLKLGAERAILLNLGDGLNTGDILRTKSKSRAQLTFTDGTKLNIAQKSRIEIKAFDIDTARNKRTVLLRSFRGKFRAIVPEEFAGEGSRFEVETPTAVAIVRGTDWLNIINPLPLSTEEMVLRGSVAVRNVKPGIAGEVILGPMMGTSVPANRPPTPPRRVRLEELIPHLRDTSPVKDDQHLSPEELGVPRGGPQIISEPGFAVPPVSPPVTDTYPEILEPEPPVEEPPLESPV